MSITLEVALHIKDMHIIYMSSNDMEPDRGFLTLGYIRNPSPGSISKPYIYAYTSLPYNRLPQL